jgi:BirA family biotin operon repressor/biotin-[acetyl-CoA-carboxylase] ligase
MQDKILAALKKRSNEYTSGEELSKKLKVSRTAVWKHIENLRNDGYQIEAHPHLGYRFVSAPDKLLADELNHELYCRIFGKKIFSYASLDSTNVTAYGLAEEGSPEGTIVVAEQQKKGKGRLGRSWISPAGTGVYLSAVLKPEIQPKEASKITLIAAVSVAGALSGISGLKCMIRWPNDIIVDSKKICGILTEMKAEQDKTAFVILGIGINVNTPASSLPKEASSLKVLTGKEYSRVEAAKAVLRELDVNYLRFLKKGFAPFLKEWSLYSAITGRRVKLTCHNRILEGTAQDIDENGALVIRLDNGLSESVLAGDVTLAR